MSNKRIVQVAGEQAVTIIERVPDYRADVVRALLDSIRSQAEGLSDKGRRDKVAKVVEALSRRVASQMKKQQG